MNYDTQTSSTALASSDLRALCETLAPDPNAQTKVPIPPGGSPVLDPAELASLLYVGASDLVLEDGLIESLAAAVSAGHVVLTGPPGTAKSTLATLVAETVKGSAWVAATATSEWTSHDVVGGYMPTTGGQVEFEPGLVLQAFADDSWLVIDELNRADIDKAFGELFTLLSGFAVTLPQRDGRTGERIVVAPENGTGTFSVPEGWRVIATMNTWDKTSLFRLSYAFMRRFSFVEVRSPGVDAYEELVSLFLAGEDLQLSEGALRAIYELFAGKALRSVGLDLGPAIAKTFITQLKAGMIAGLDEQHALAAALAARVFPQFEGAYERHSELVAALEGVFDLGDLGADVRSRLVRELGSWTGAVSLPADSGD